MFDTLSESLQKVFKNLRGYGKLTESNVKDALREVRLALLEADVNYQVAKDFINRVRENCLGEEVLNSITPGQQVIKRVQDEMVHLLGDTRRSFDLSAHPAKILMLGLHGAGKTTTSGKLALKWKNEGKNVMLVACDIRRPAAVEQLRLLAAQVGVAIVTPNPGETVPQIGARAYAEALKQGVQILLFDTGGRFQLDEELVQELKDLRREVNPHNVVLVLDAAMGQQSVEVASTFHQTLNLTGLILTKLDGDARGGAALSVQSVTGCPVLLTGTGEKLEDLEDFYPERMASRILGMGDVVGLVEKAQQTFALEDMQRMEERMQKNKFDLDDFLEQLRQLKKMGPLENILEMLPLGGQVPAKVKDGLAAGFTEKEMKKTEAIILSMTSRERRRPEMIAASRKRRIARGSGTQVQEVNELLRNFTRARKMSKMFKKMQKGLRRHGK
ncbi:MAG: signal recognition particle protein [Kiritimatiellae bacterium]|nr:signal recognition particle protein [Kiritimatiellia bacterium]